VHDCQLIPSSNDVEFSASETSSSMPHLAVAIPYCPLDVNKESPVVPTPAVLPQFNFMFEAQHPSLRAGQVGG
jgi:hypothetical protein